MTEEQERDGRKKLQAGYEEESDDTHWVHLFYGEKYFQGKSSEVYLFDEFHSTVCDKKSTSPLQRG